MPNNFHYAASSYLDEWMGGDLQFYAKLGVESESRHSSDIGAKALLDFATRYGVIRTLKLTTEASRLGWAYDALKAVEQPTESDVTEKVESFARSLGGEYCVGKIPLSAASKFLWMRFRSPVIIYDSLAVAWLHQHTKYADNAHSTYGNYYRSWRNEYSKCEEEVRGACYELNRVKKFTLACDESDEILFDWTSSRWFQERVFDYYMLNAKLFNQLASKPDQQHH